MRPFVSVLVFLMLVNEGFGSGTHYPEKMFAPFFWVDGLLFDPLPIKVRLFDLLLVAVALAGAGAKGPTVRPMRNTLFLALGTTVTWFLLGLLRGGSSLYASWQTYLMLASLVGAFAIARTFGKAVHYRMLAKAIVAAAIYRAIMCLIFYLSYVRNSGVEAPPTFTSHDDSVLWVVAIVILIVNFLENRKTLAKAGVFLAVPLMVTAIQLNNRRLAWVSLAGSLLALYFMTPPSPGKVRLRRIARIVGPVLAVYVIVGWGRSEAIFKPVASISSVSDQTDNSTKSRNNENLSLIATARYRPLTGTGWGHRFVLLSYTYVAQTTELWPYIPHNSVLGLFAFTGLLGIMGFWMMFPTAVFLHARTARLATLQAQRNVGVIGVVVIVVCLNQLFGDMGIFSRPNMYMLSMSLGAATRVPVEAGAWSVLKPAAAQPAAPPSPQSEPSRA